jgi:hypothetical protein
MDTESSQSGAVDLDKVLDPFSGGLEDYGQTWDVTVIGGVRPPDALVELAQAKADADYVDATGRYMATYEDVFLETRSPGSISMWRKRNPDGNGYVSYHVIEGYRVTFNRFHGMEIEGYEVRGDGVMVASRWEVAPAAPVEG